MYLLPLFLVEEYMDLVDAEAEERKAQTNLGYAQQGYAIEVVGLVMA